MNSIFKIGYMQMFHYFTVRGLLLLCFFMINYRTFAVSPKNYTEAKGVALMIWREHPRTFYCGCEFDKFGVIDFDSCDYLPEDKRKDKRITWEHIVPVSWFGKNLECWNDMVCHSKNGKKFKGRNCCGKINENFKKMESDLHNLVPVIRSVNVARSNYSFGEFNPENKQEKYHFRHCNLVIDERFRVVEPTDEVKGAIARVCFYMSDKYGIKLNHHQKRILTDWNNRFPPDPWEIRRNKKIAAIQGDRNKYIY